MTSISSKTTIQERVDQKLKFSSIAQSNSKDEIYEFMKDLMEEEYRLIPKKERIGKGSVYLAKIIGVQCYRWLKERSLQSSDFWDFINGLIQRGDDEKDQNLYNLGLTLFAHYMSESSLNLRIGFNLLAKYATHPNWEIREMAGYAIRQCLKFNAIDTIASLWTYVSSNDENIRRIVSESLRPMADIPWLRDPERNGMVLELLTSLRADPSVYVRKSVGNNLKDLSKYMPKIILYRFESWSKQFKIEVTDDLASKSKSELGEISFYFVWMMKHALRWLRARNPEFHPQITELLGKNYVLYFDEKTNRLAKPSK